jgi:hypothetical protein
MIAVATLQEMDSNLADYGTAYTQILRLANDSTKQDFLSFIETLNGTDIRLLADLDVQIEDGDTFESVERKLNFASVYDAMFG